MWDTKLIEENARSQKIQILSKEQSLSFNQVIDLWKNSEAFRRYYNELLAQMPFSAFYWETPPLRADTVNQHFEFVVIDSLPLTKVTANAKPFREQFGAALVNSFWNLGADAKLIVPRPLLAERHYAHLAAFVRSEAGEQQDQFWQLVGLEYEAALGEQPRWLSTAGLGVSWLHLRIDSRPKYYRHAPYRIVPE